MDVILWAIADTYAIAIESGYASIFTEKSTELVIFRRIGGKA